MPPFFRSQDDSQESSQTAKAIGRVLFLAGLTYLVPTMNSTDWTIGLFRLCVGALGLYVALDNVADETLRLPRP
jgi:hypothetical protein